MDNEAIMDQIVRSLSFEVIAAPQNVTKIDSTSKSTPLNIKIRVRKKHGTDLRHGVLSMPKVDIKKDSRKSPERVRLVSSDQTIMNFSVIMEADFDKRHQKQNTNIISPDVQVNNEDSSNLSLNRKKNNTSPIVSRRNNDIFGKCKPGGCLDPPFGEDIYSYQPTKQKLSMPLKDDPGKLRSSSIFKNNIFKRKKKISQSDNDLNIPDSMHKNEVEYTSKTNLNDKIPLEVSAPYSNSIITYPHPSDSELHRSEEKKTNREEDQSYRKRYSSGQMSKTSSKDDGSYFVIPKKSKNLSIQNDLSKMQKNNSILEENKNILTPNLEKFDANKTDESKLICQTHNFLPTPLVAPSSSIVNSKLNNPKPSNNDMFGNVQEVKNQEKIKSDDKTEIITAHDNHNLTMEQKGIILSESETRNYSHAGSKTEQTVLKENKIQLQKCIESLDIKECTSVLDENRHSNSSLSENQYINDEHNIQKLKNCELGKIQNISSINENFNNTDKYNDENSQHILSDEINPNSHPLLPESREKSLLDVINNVADQIQLNTTKEQNFTMEENYQNISSSDLKKIWKNNTAELISKADVITTKNIKQNVQSDEDNYENQGLHKIIPGIDSNINSITAPSTPIIKNSIENVNLVNNFNESNTTPLRASNEILRGKFTKTENYVENDSPKTYIDEDTKQDRFIENIKTKLSNDNIQRSKSGNLDSIEQNTNNQLNKYEGVHNHEYIAKLDDLNNTIHPIDTSNKNKSFIDKIEEIFPTVTNLAEDDNITVNGLYQFKRKLSVSAQSIIGSGSSTYIAANISDKQDSKYVKMNSSTDLAQAMTSQSKKEDILNEVILKQTQSEMTNDTNEITFGSKMTDQSDQNHFPEKMIDQSDQNHFPEKMIDQSDQNYFPEKMIDRSDQNYFPEKMIDQSDQNHFAEKMIDQSDQNYLPEKMIDRNDQNYFPEKMIDQSDQNHFPEKIIDQSDQNYLQEKMIDRSDQNYLPEKMIDQSDQNHFPEKLTKTPIVLQSTSILRPDTSLWKIDIALQSYVNENNERIIKSFDSKNTPEKHLNEAFLVARCSFGNESNEIKIPIDQYNDLSVRVVPVKSSQPTLVEFKGETVSAEKLGQKRIKRAVSNSQQQTQADIYECNNVSDNYGMNNKKSDVTVSDSAIDGKHTAPDETNKTDTNINEAIMNGELRNTLNLIYEEELIPLQDMIKGIREDIDTLVAYQMKLRVQNYASNRAKQLKMWHTNKKCSCLRKL